MSGSWGNLAMKIGLHGAVCEEVVEMSVNLHVEKV